MKVLQINSVCGYGSTGNIVVDLYRALKEQGHECCVAYGRGNAPEDVQSYRIGSDVDVYVHGILSRITDKQGFYSTRATKRFVQWMKEYDPDVIHLHNLHGYYINIEILFDALKQMDKPVVWTLHDCWAFTGHCAHFEYAGCDKWKTRCQKCPQKKEYPTSLFFDNSKNNYIRKQKVICELDRMTIVTPSQWLKNLVEESFLQKYPSEVIHNGIDLNIFHPTYKNLKEKYGLQDKKIILGVASEWGKRKGLQDFFKLSDLLDNRYQIVIIGHIDVTPPERNNITYISRTNDREELAAWYTEADVFFNPTYEDNYPTVNLEAQACGTPVITYDTGGSPEGVKNGNGMIVPQGALQEVVFRLENRDYSSALKNKGMFSKESMLKEYIKLYQEQQQGLMKD